MDPFKEGINIFSGIAQGLESDRITDIKKFELFLKELYLQTSGYVIFDFLDAGNWDSFESFEFDYERGLVYINWHDYRNREEANIDQEMGRGLFPADVYGLCFQFQELRVITIDDVSLFSFRGYALSTSEVEKILRSNTQQFEIIHDDDNFSIGVIRQINNEWHSYRFLNTPIFSTLIVPKNLDISAFESRSLLFKYNISQSIRRIDRIGLDFENFDTDEICEKGNTLRSILEGVIKIECCYRCQQINVKKSYSELLLGDLVKLVKDFKSHDIKLEINTIVRLSNNFSHDSGKPILKEKLKELILLTLKYCLELIVEIQENPYP